MNQITGFLDGNILQYCIVKMFNRTLFVLGSNVYGSDTEDEESLRLYKGGLLKYKNVIFSLQDFALLLYFRTYKPEDSSER